MFAINENLDINVIRNIKGRSAVIIDNFYKNPDEIREFALSQKSLWDGDLTSGLPGKRCLVETPEVKENLYDIYFQLCSDKHIWHNPNSSGLMRKLKPGRDRPFNVDMFNNNWNDIGFICNIINDSSLKKKPIGIIPHQDVYEIMPATNVPVPHVQFASVVYLNLPNECVNGGGTALYSFKNQISIDRRDDIGIPMPDNPDDYPTDEDQFNYIKSKIDEGDPWKIECEVEIVYNRMVLYQADVLHGQNVDLGMFTNYDRINQVLFM
jgi:hypothetical protein